MKYLLMFCLAVTLFACNNQNNTTTKKVKGELQNKTTCTFELTSTLHLNPQDTEQFVKDSYLQFTSDSSDNMMQIFIYGDEVDVNEKVKDEIDAVSKPEIFTPKTTIPMNKVANYTGNGVSLKGIYAGGLIKGTINIFGCKQSGKSFVLVRQTVGGQNQDKADFDLIETTFKLK